MIILNDGIMLDSKEKSNIAIAGDQSMEVTIDGDIVGCIHE